MVRLSGWLWAMAVALPLAACSVAEAPSRAATPEGLTTLPPGPFALPEGIELLRLQYQVTEVRVAVPKALRVSEANMFYPVADIVWRGEPAGDRHAQVAAIVRDGILRGTADMAQGPRVIVEAEVTRFHSLTEKARYTTGGVHAVSLILTVRDADSGAVIDGPRPLSADVKGSGGAQALADDQLGITMRVVIVDRVAQVVRRALAAPVDPALTMARPDPRSDPRIDPRADEGAAVSLLAAAN